MNVSVSYWLSDADLYTHPSPDTQSYGEHTDEGAGSRTSVPSQTISISVCVRVAAALVPIVAGCTPVASTAMHAASEATRRGGDRQ